ncbi:MAG: acyl carrier protein [Gammaproteobacteria bacterium]|nr:MAG: acyl carrier protein [Gammaproteobacteria bacterium]
MNSREEIFSVLSNLLVDLFEVDPADITLQANLYDDLDVDSIDAVDMVVELRKITGQKIDPDEFKSVRTVADVVDAVAGLVGVQ